MRKTLLMTDVRGLLPDKEDEGTLIPVVNVSDVPGLKNQGIISGRHDPQDRVLCGSVRRGVHRTHIVDGRIPHSPAHRAVFR